MGWEGKTTSRIGEYVSRTSIGAYFHTARESRKLVLVIVAIALLLDNMLLTCVVPIIPEYLYQIRHQHDNLTTAAPMQSTTPLPEMGSGEFIDITESTITTTTLSPEERKHKELVEENMEVGMMFASKAFVQLIANPFVGPLTNKIGYSIPMFCGFIIMFFSTIIFALGGVTQYCFLQELSKASAHHAPVSQGWACWPSVTQTTRSEGTRWVLPWEDSRLELSSVHRLGGSCTSLLEKQHRSLFWLSWPSLTDAFNFSFFSRR